MSVFLGALATSLVLTGMVIPLLRGARFMDVPNHRSSHVRAVPRGGGMAVIATFLFVALVAVDLDSEVIAILAVTFLLGVVGLADDLLSLPSSARLAAQFASALGLSVLLLTQGEVSWWWLPALVVAIAGYVNAFNFVDGINGISALTAVVIGAWWVWAGNNQGEETVTILGLMLAGAALGFLPWNAPRAHVFLGDVGSYGLGVYIAGLSALALTRGMPWAWALAPLVVYGADTGWVLMKRFRGGRPLTEAHREHVYQRLVDGGWSHVASAVLCAGATGAICAAVGLTGAKTLWLPAGVAMAIVLLYIHMPRIMGARETIR